MEIVWHGHSFFEITTKHAKIAIDPFSKEIGLLPKRTKADILLISHHHPDHCNKEVILGEYFLIDSPGEYELKNVFVDAIESFHDEKEGKERGKNLIFVIEAEGKRICHLGDFGQKELKEEQRERIGSVNLLLVPVGGKFTISAKEAVKLVKELQPNIVIPMHYFVEGLKFKLDKVDEFLKLMGEKNLKPIPKLKLKKDEKLPEESKVVLLSF
ncbi:MBL fold metallo-hydrolase [Candidatus Parcubacteria bacterium]|nr:MBL fold metallo-hydrolase [Candidatus Parcubacteria bacterium]